MLKLQNAIAPGFCKEGFSLSRCGERGGKGSRWDPMHMVEEPGQPKKKPKKTQGAIVAAGTAW